METHPETEGYGCTISTELFDRTGCNYLCRDWAMVGLRHGYGGGPLAYAFLSFRSNVLARSSWPSRFHFGLSELVREKRRTSSAPPIGYAGTNRPTHPRRPDS